MVPLWHDAEAVAANEAAATPLYHDGRQVAKYAAKMVAKNCAKFSDMSPNHFLKQDFYVTHKTCVRLWSAGPLVLKMIMIL